MLGLYLFQRVQGVLSLNPTDVDAVPSTLSFNTAVSFVTNTNWQNYGGESTMSHLTQMAGLTVQNFVSAAVGMSVAVALIRGLVRRRSATIGNFWVDLTRSVTRVLRAALRRSLPAGEEATVETEAFSVNLAEKRVTAGGADVRLTPTEWHIVEILVRNPGKLITQRQVLREVWGPQYHDETNYLRVFLAQIRRKLEPRPSRPRYFVTAPGMGYRVEP